jgi:hypothetical protein
MLFELFAHNLFLFLNVPEIAQVSPRQHFFCLDQAEKPFAEQEGGQRGSGLIEHGLFAEKFVLATLTNAVKHLSVK